MQVFGPPPTAVGRSCRGSCGGTHCTARSQPGRHVRRGRPQLRSHTPVLRRLLVVR